MSADAAYGPLIIGVSACLLGEKVRYDGGHKCHPVVAHELATTGAQIVPVCPEVEMGFLIPRPAIHLLRKENKITAVVSTTRADITDPLGTMADRLVKKYPKIAGFVSKSRSPSCGHGSAKLHHSEVPVDGAFLARLKELRPGIPIIEEIMIENRKSLDRFLVHVSQYAEEQETD